MIPLASQKVKKNAKLIDYEYWTSQGVAKTARKWGGCHNQGKQCCCSRCICKSKSSPRVLHEKSFVPKISLINAQSLFPKIDELRAIVSMSMPSTICITEAWLSSAVEDNLLLLSWYNLKRCDRYTHKGSGTAIFVRESIVIEQHPLLKITFRGVENILIRLVQQRIFVACLYIPPSTPLSLLHDITDHLNARIDEISCEYLNHEIIITGDFNKLKIEDICYVHDLKDLVRKPTRQGSFLDHILVSRRLHSLYSHVETRYDCPLGNSDHNVITATPRFQEYSNVPVQSYITSHSLFDFRQSNVDMLINQAAIIDWDKVVEEFDVDAKWNSFETCLQLLLKTCIPHILVQKSKKDKDWITPLIKHLINERWKAYQNRNWPLYEHLKIK